MDLGISMKGEDFFFDFINLLHYKSWKINLNHCRSYVVYLTWIKKATINPVSNYDNKCYQYGGTVTSNKKEIEKNQKEYQ